MCVCIHHARGKGERERERERERRERDKEDRDKEREQYMRQPGYNKPVVLHYSRNEYIIGTKLSILQS